MVKDTGKSTMLKGLAKDLSKFSVKDPGVHTSGLVKQLSKSNVMKGLSKNGSFSYLVSLYIPGCESRQGLQDSDIFRK